MNRRNRRHQERVRSKKRRMPIEFKGGAMNVKSQRQMDIGLNMRSSINLLLNEQK